MALDTIELWLSLLVIGQQLLIAMLFVARRRPRRQHLAGALLVLSAAAYLVQSAEPLRAALSTMRPLVIALALAVPYLLWHFAHIVFEMRALPRAAIAAVLTVPACAWIVFVAGDSLAPIWSGSVYAVNHIVGLSVVLYTLWSILAQRGDDLLERRRCYRLAFVVLIGAQVSGILVAELVIAADAVPGWLRVANVGLIAALTAGLAWPVLQLNEELFWQPDKLSFNSEPSSSSARSRTGDERLAERLSELMGTGFYRTPELSIGRLAGELSVAEHQLRRLINEHLGYRNFSAFLNRYRIRDAKNILADPGEARTKVLSVAMSLGYGSIGPFNRAFKQSTGCTPSEFRDKALADS